MTRERLTKPASENVLEFDYDGSSYRFVKPGIWQNSFYSIQKAGVFYEYNVLKDMRTRLKERDLVIDVGANVGNHTVFMAGVCRCDVIAFEPYAKTFKVLTRNIDLNQLNDRVTAINMAVGAKPGYGQICIPSTTNYGEIKIKDAAIITDIRVESLDNIDLPRPPRLIKIDVEGSEVAVLEGAESLIRRSSPLIYLEALSEKAFATVCEFLYKMDYRAANFFEPAMFMFASIEDPVFAMKDNDVTNQLTLLCFRYYNERKAARLRLRNSKCNWLRRLKKIIKGKSLSPREIRQRRIWRRKSSDI